MLIPAPTPTYTLAPGLELDAGQRASLHRALKVVAGSVAGVVVVAVRRVGALRVVELQADPGRLLVLDTEAETVGSPA
jgi:hypothetical protein